MVDFTLPQQGMDGDSSVVVAPLNIQKSTNKSPIEAFSHSRQSSSKGSHSVRSHSQSQPSPPLTPRSSQEGMNSHTPPQPVFHNYLRAFYHYTPSSITSTSSDESSITVAIKQGDVILVHSVHPNGWADGTLLASGARGWLPTNYCEPYDHPTIRNLLNALTNLWDLVRDGENGNVTAFTKQDYVRGMIAGIRFFLVSKIYTHRISPLLNNHSPSTGKDRMLVKRFPHDRGARWAATNAERSAGRSFLAGQDSKEIPRISTT